MTYPVYAMRDLKAGFGIPEISINDQTMKRTFSFRMNQNGTEAAFSPADYQLFRIGQYDIDKGEMIPEMPVLIVEGVDCVGVK